MSIVSRGNHKDPPVEGNPVPGFACYVRGCLQVGAPVSLFGLFGQVKHSRVDEDTCTQHRFHRPA